ncbi:hypothetical protein D3C81_1328160 [compost metagenome]
MQQLQRPVEIEIVDGRLQGRHAGGVMVRVEAAGECAQRLLVQLATLQGGCKAFERTAQLDQRASVSRADGGPAICRSGARLAPLRRWQLQKQLFQGMAQRLRSAK